MKKVISVLLITILILGSLTLTACGNKGMQFVQVKDVENIKDEKTRELIDSLSFLDKCRQDDYICILTDGATGEVEIPSAYKDDDVVYVTAFSDACKDITKLSLPENARFLQYVCNFDSDNDSLTAVTPAEKMVLSDCFNFCTALDDAAFKEVRTMKNCFNGCTALTAISGFYSEPFESGSYTLESSYCDCAALTNIELEGFEALSGSFNNCGTITAVMLKGASRIDDSFNSCSALEELTLNIPGQTISDSFNDCIALKKLDWSRGNIEGSFNQCASLTELSVNSSVADSFNNAEALTKLTVYGNTVTNAFNNAKKLASLETAAAEFKNALNDCTALKSVKVEKQPKTISESFKNCPVDITKLGSEEEKRAKEKAEEEKKAENHEEDFKAIVEAAWRNLAKTGAVSFDTNDDLYIKFEEATAADGERCDQPILGDRSDLLSEPDLDLSRVVLLDNKYKIYKISDVSDKLYAKNYEDCRYIIVYEEFTSKQIPNYYMEVGEGSKMQKYSRTDVTTLVYIVDAEEKKIVSIHSVGTDVPPDEHPKSTSGEIMEDEAKDYIKKLLS